MNRPLTLLSVLVLAAVGIAIWFFAQGSDPAPVLPTPGNTQRDSAAVDPAAGATVAADPAAAKNTAGNDRRELEPVVSDAGKDGPAITVSGRLVDSRKAPRPATEIEIDRVRSASDLMLVPLVRDENRSDRERIKTGDDGRFTFRLAAGYFAMLSLPSDELVFQGSVDVQNRGSDVDIGDVVALVCCRVSGTVTDHNGNPIAGVRVTGAADGLALGFGGSSLVTTKADGRFVLGKLRPGKLVIRTASPNYLPGMHELELQPEDRKDGVVLQLQQGAAIAGQVVDDAGVPQAGVKVTSKRQQQRGGVQIQQFRADEATTTDSNGFFTLSGLEGERATVRAWRKGLRNTTVPDVAIGTGDLVVQMPRLGTISGTLRGTDGKPIADSRVTAGQIQTGPMAIEPEFDLTNDLQAARTDADGRFEVKATPGLVVLTAEGKTHRPAERRGIDLAPGATLNGIDLIAELGAVLTAKVTDMDGKPVADATVEVSPVQDEAPSHGVRVRGRRVERDNDEVRIGGPDESFRGKTDAAGVAVIAGLPAGAMNVAATSRDHAAAEAQRVTLPQVGTVECSLAMRKPGYAAITVADQDGKPLAEARFQLVGPLGTPEQDKITGTTDASGMARMGPLVPGDYRAELCKKPQPRNIGGGTFMLFESDEQVLPGASQRVQIAAGNEAEVALVMPLLATITGRVTDLNGPVAGVEVELAGANDTPMMPGAAGASARSDAEGNYRLEQIVDGDYRLSYGRPEQIVKAEEPLQVRGGGEVRHDIVLRYGSVRLKVIDAATKEPVAGATVELERRAQGPRREERRMVMISMRSLGEDGPEATTMEVGNVRRKTDANGICEIDAVPPGSYVAKITCEPFAPGESAPLAVVESQACDGGEVLLKAAGSIAGRLLDAAGAQATMGLVECVSVDRPQDRDVKPAQGGRFRFAGLTPGRYKLRGSAFTMGGGGPKFGEAIEVEVRAGKEPTTADVTMAR